MLISKKFYWHLFCITEEKMTNNYKGDVMKKLNKLIFAVTMGLVLTLPVMVMSKDFSPKELEKAVNSTIDHYYQLDPPLTVKANNDGRVVLKGSVDNLFYKYKIYDLVAKIDGVKEISDQILVNTESLPDDIIRDNILNEMHYVSLIQEPDDINVSVKNGIVELNGKVSFFYEKDAMNSVATWQRGVKGLINNIKVLPLEKATSDKNIENIINEILKNDFPREDALMYTVNDGKVNLYGTATSMWAKENLADDVSALIGVRSVDNNIQVK